MEVSGTNLSMVKGDTEEIVVYIEEFPFQTGDIVEMTVRKAPSAPDKILYKKITTFNEDGKAIINIEHDDTSDVKPGSYHYDIQLTYDTNKVKTIIKNSILTIEPEVTYD